AYDRARQNREFPDNERDFSMLQRSDKFFCMRVLAVKHGEIAPGISGNVPARNFRRNPMRFPFGADEFSEANLLTVRVFGDQSLVRQQRRFFIVSDYFAGYPQDSGSRAIILRERRDKLAN